MAKLCGFSTLRCLLTTLNVFYIVVGVFLIGLVVAARTLSYFTHVPILVGIAICGTLLVTVAILGLIGTIKHHQVVLFFYMLILFFSGIILFCVSVAALAAPDSLKRDVFFIPWQGLSIYNKEVIQSHLDCCGFDNDTRYFIQESSDECVEGHPRCNTTDEELLVRCCEDDQNYTPLPVGNNTDQCMHEMICLKCKPCYNSWEEAVSRAVLLAGSFGLIFSFTQVIGIVLTCWYRNQKDPNANPSAFL